MGDIAAEKRQLTIKTGVVRRLSKELWMYTVEAKEQDAKVQQFIADNREAWEVRKQEEILKDCTQMVPDTKRRLSDAVVDLDAYLHGLDEATKETDEYRSAVEALDKSKESP
ncbi:uncharacterized protein MJAP1_000192 [Malassezia japonica]|uniref:Tubulin-specific chaperone A n=1 Tax=Malassezia japonica TaxID=223818 RepID=A0AAF0EY69_9BASI|nr:uncharacterized protein MJAP1_000192 [Malassezia japonica]WFD37250.1 hypothetical protein MJAP1_000192 [Malassezia japonica]